MSGKIFRNWKLPIIGLAALLGIGAFAYTPTASAQVFVGRVGFYGGPRAFYGPGPLWYGGYWGGPVVYTWGAPHSGNVKIETKAKDASVYVDGGFAGVAHDLKKFNLRPGTHNIELRSPDGQTFYQQEINVIPGKTLKIVA